MKILCIFLTYKKTEIASLAIKKTYALLSGSESPNNHEQRPLAQTTVKDPLKQNQARTWQPNHSCSELKKK